MNKFINKISKITFVNTTAIRLINAYKSAKLNFVNFKYNEAQNPSITKEELIEYNRNRKFKVAKEICFAPQKSMIFSFDGNVYLCCENKKDSIGHILQESIHEIWFGEKRKLLDKKINQDYNLSSGCKNCEYKIQNKNFSTVQAQIFDLYTDNKSNYPARLEFEIHNTCNLECIMCSGIYSSSIQSNRNKLPNVPNLYTDKFIQQLDEFIPHLNSINLLGGEPTLIKPYYDIIEKVIQLNPSCFIHLQTNASTLNQRFKKLLERGNFEIGISLDALSKELAESIRVNLDFNKFMENVAYYIELHKQNKIKLTVNTCPMPLNWQELVPIIKFCNSNQLPVFICVVNAPFYNTFYSTSVEFIEMVLQELTISLNELPKSNYFEKNNYKQLEDFIAMLISWKSLVDSFNKNKSSYMNNSVEELFDQFKNRFSSLLIYEHKDLVVNETMEYIFTKFSNLDAETKRELLITLLNVVKDPIVVTSEKELMRWTQEYISTLIFSYENRLAQV